MVEIISHVAEFLKSVGLSNIMEEDIKNSFPKLEELSIEEGVLLWRYRIVVPIKLKKSILSELHLVQLGIVKMKSLARSYFWWQSMDKEIKNAGNVAKLARKEPIPFHHG